MNGKGGNSGKSLQVALESLPENAQQKYLIERMNQEVAVTSQNINRAFDNCNESQKSSAIQKLKALEAYNLFEREEVEKNPKLSKTQCKKDFIEDWNKNHDFQLSKTTFYRMLQDYKKEGITGLIDNRGGHNKSSSSIPADIWKLFKSMYLTQTQPSIQECYNNVRLMATEKCIPNG